MSRRAMITLVTIFVLVAAGVFVVAAQDDSGSVQPYGPGWMHNWDSTDFGPGMMRGRGMGMMGDFGPGMMWAEDEPMMSAVADALGMDLTDLFAAFQNGQSLEEIAQAQSVELASVYDAMTAQAEEHMAEFVAAGTITQEEADAHLAWMQENIASVPMFAGNGFGPCMGAQSGFGPGMMGRGRGAGMMGGWNG
ncbi:MAG: hypothetical protein KC546_00120 [Anaerolineae bacterium]|nr:hypothetical protein [Anaerolineae bacterium]MCA9886734.1 hypothetical protein [Anaerolineae bacterium]MCA9891359.1 hypothetical protein [Anaerolineae bacterium]